MFCGDTVFVITGRRLYRGKIDLLLHSFLVCLSGLFY